MMLGPIIWRKGIGGGRSRSRSGGSVPGTTSSSGFRIRGSRFRVQFQVSGFRFQAIRSEDGRPTSVSHDGKAGRDTWQLTSQALRASSTSTVAITLRMMCPVIEGEKEDEEEDEVVAPEP
jgi:hypothetical protein